MLSTVAPTFPVHYHPASEANISFPGLVLCVQKTWVLGGREDVCGVLFSLKWDHSYTEIFFFNQTICLGLCTYI